jgi:hypothetical protein
MQVLEVAVHQPADDPGVVLLELGDERVAPLRRVDSCRFAGGGAGSCVSRVVARRRV